MYPIIDIDKAIFETSSELKANVQISSVSIDDFDLMIASKALPIYLILVTNNEKHFKRIK